MSLSSSNISGQPENSAAPKALNGSTPPSTTQPYQHPLGLNPTRAQERRYGEEEHARRVAATEAKRLAQARSALPLNAARTAAAPPAPRTPVAIPIARPQLVSKAPPSDAERSVATPSASTGAGSERTNIRANAASSTTSPPKQDAAPPPPPQHGDAASARVNAAKPKLTPPPKERNTTTRSPQETKQPAPTAPNPRGRPFQPGNSFGRGRPKGSLNKATLIARALVDECSEAIIRTCVERAKAGDTAALRLLMPMILPRRKGIPIQLEIPEIRTPQDLADAILEVQKLMNDGVITAEEAWDIISVLERVAEAQREADPFKWH